MNLLLDCDGVIADFKQASLERLHAAYGVAIPPIHECTSYHTDVTVGVDRAQFWKAVDDEKFWAADIKPYPWAKHVLSIVKGWFGDNWYIATAPSSNPACASAKVRWLKKHFNIPVDKLMIGGAKHLMARPDNILMDDYEKNIRAFEEAGGKTILFPQYWNGFTAPISDLDELTKYLTNAIELCHR